jgi:electron transfer flavoprotein alpha subunit
MYSDKSKGNVLILAEHSGEEIDSVTTHLIVKGRELAEKMGVALDALLMGSGLDQQARKLNMMGVDRVLLIDHASLQLYNPQLYLGVIARIIKDHTPSVFLLGYTYWGMVVAPGVATRLGTKLFTNCLDVELTEDRVRVTRPMFGGAIYTKVEAKKSSPIVVSLQRSTIPVKAAPEGIGEIVPLRLEISEDILQVKALGILAEIGGRDDLKKAEVIVSAGRGIKEKANLKLIEDFADALGGVVGCSRPLVDLGWLPLSYQVGISGKTVRPKIYIACGISGAMQHVSAITDSQMITAINSDPKAPIFRVAKYGIVGDLFEVIPAIMKKAKELNVRAGKTWSN